MKKIIRPIMLALLTTLACCSVSTSSARGIKVLSNVPKIAIASLSVLPPAQKVTDDATSCTRHRIKPTSQGGIAAARLGWGVTGELVIGDFDVVSFVAGFQPGTSGACLLNDGNLGFFIGKQLMAVAYGTTPASKPGRIEAVGATGARIWNGDYVQQPIADVQLGDNSITIVPLAAEDTFCEGHATVPNIYGKPMEKARRQLVDRGWKPEELPTEIPGMNCAGSGLALCSLAYQSGAAVLSIVTAGEEMSSVVSYSVECKKQIRP